MSLLEEDDTEFERGYWAALDDFPSQLNEVRNKLDTLEQLYYARLRTERPQELQALDNPSEAERTKESSEA